MRGLCPACGEEIDLDDVDLQLVGSTKMGVGCPSCEEPIQRVRDLDPVPL